MHTGRRSGNTESINKLSKEEKSDEQNKRIKGHQRGIQNEIKVNLKGNGQMDI
jgi:hypothetical protein